MARIKGALATRKRRKKILKLAKGYWGSKSKHFKMAKPVSYTHLPGRLLYRCTFGGNIPSGAGA